MISKKRKRIINSKLKNTNEIDEYQFGQQWAFQQIDVASSRIRQVSATQWSLTHPQRQLTLQPGQTGRIQTGWQIADIPEGYNCSFVPNQSILSKGLYIPPKIFDESHIGSEITINVYNSSEKEETIDEGWDIGQMLLSAASSIIPAIIGLL